MHGEVELLIVQKEGKKMQANLQGNKGEEEMVRNSLRARTSLR